MIATEENSIFECLTLFTTKKFEGRRLVFFFLLAHTVGEETLFVVQRILLRRSPFADCIYFKHDGNRVRSRIDT